MFSKVKNSEWYTNPKMLGHIRCINLINIAEEKINKLGILSVKITNYAKYMFFDECDDWHVFSNNLNKTYIDKVIKVLKAIRSEKYDFPTLNIMKSRIDHVVDYESITINEEIFKYNYTHWYMNYGMSYKDAVNRYNVYRSHIINTGKSIEKYSLPIDK